MGLLVGHLELGFGDEYLWDDTMGTKGPLARLGPVDARYRLEAYATINGCAVEVVGRLYASSALPDRRTGVCTQESKRLYLRWLVNGLAH